MVVLLRPCIRENGPSTCDLPSEQLLEAAAATTSSHSRIRILIRILSTYRITRRILRNIKLIRNLILILILSLSLSLNLRMADTRPCCLLTC
jgi:hypothetical protein